MIEILLLGLAGFCHSQRDLIEIKHKYDKSFYSKLRNQKWFNPRLSWKNKKSKYKIWEFIKSTILVFLTDYKHFIKFIEKNSLFTFAYLLTNIEYHIIIYYIAVNFIYGIFAEVGFFIHKK